jgi:small subunit ribosomal protein S7
MPRRPLKPRQKRDQGRLDSKYNNILLERFINKINFAGKKATAEKIVYGAIDYLKQKTSEDGVKVFITALENIRPLVEVKARRIGGATYQVPLEVPKFRGETIAMRWLIQYSRERKGMAAFQKFGEEILAAYKKEGSAIKKREDTHKMAEANKAFAHYRW